MLSKAQNLPDDVVKTLTELAGDADPAAAALIALEVFERKQQLIELLLTGIQDASPRVQGAAALVSCRT